MTGVKAKRLSYSLYIGVLAIVSIMNTKEISASQNSLPDNDQGGRLTPSDYLNAEDRRFYRFAEVVKLNDDNDATIFEGDIISDEEHYASEIITNINKKWPKVGEYVILPFTFPSTATDQQKADIARVVLEFRNKTSVRMTEHNGETDWIHINTNRLGCASRVGRQGGMQTIRAHGCLAEGGSFGLLVHEVMHALGVYHQHSREDRDQFITINMPEVERAQSEDNVFRNAYKKQYEKCLDCESKGDYDISSIMHYSAFLGMKKRTVIIPKPGVCDSPTCHMGQRTQLSIGDVDDIQRLYDCGLKYSQYGELCERKMEKELDTLCKLIDCDSDEAKRICPIACREKNSEKICLWTTIGGGGCLDSNQNEYSSVWSSDGNFSTLKMECESTENCLGVEWGAWNPKGKIIVSANSSRTEALFHVSNGTGSIASSGPSFHVGATCYAYNCYPHKKDICVQISNSAFTSLLDFDGEYKMVNETLFVNTDREKNSILTFGYDGAWNGCLGNASYVDPSCFPYRRWAFINDLATPINGKVNPWGPRGDSSGYIPCTAAYEHVQNQYCGEPANVNHSPTSTWEGFTVDTCRQQCDQMVECASFSYTNANWGGTPWCVHYTSAECVLTPHPNWDHYIKPQACSWNRFGSIVQDEGNGLQGNPFESTSLKECQKMCDDKFSEGCQSFGYCPIYHGGQCWLFDKKLNGTETQTSRTDCYTNYRSCSGTYVDCGHNSATTCEECGPHCAGDCSWNNQNSTCVNKITS